MPALGILFVVAGAFALRQVIVGRAKETPTDLRDAATALLSGDTSTFAGVLARRGSTDSVGGVDGSPPTVPGSGSTALAAECVKLGTAAQGYGLGQSGPQFYDCSGLIWKAMRDLGIYRGRRFTTATFEHVAAGFATRVPNVEAGAVAIWVSGGHMGIMLDESSFYSARSPEKGIGTAPISADIKYFGAEPDYWRVTG